MSPRDFSRTPLSNPQVVSELPLTSEVEASDSKATLLWRRIEAQPPAPATSSWERKALADTGPCAQCGRPASAVCYGMCAVCVADDATSESQFLQARRGPVLGAKDQKR